LTSPNALLDIAAIAPHGIVYITDYQSLKKNDIKAFLDLVSKRPCIISSSERIDDAPFEIIEMENESSFFDHGEILPIEEYVKYIMTNFQNKFPDTELSKKLGISRKSLWEKRKKYGIVKKK
jgi:transcriptional regulator of aromatic amino acid metabolism